MTLVYLGIAWALGIVYAQATPPEPLTALLFVGIAAGGVWWLREYPRARLVMLACVVAGLGMGRMLMAESTTQADHIARLNDIGITTMQGVIISEPEATDSGQRFILEAQQAAGRPASGRVLVDTSRYEAVQYGDELRIAGTPRTPPRLDDFNYRDYLARERVFSVVYNAEAEVLRENAGPYRTLLEAKDAARQRIQAALPEPYAGLLVGILLGDESGISPQTQTAFQQTGTAHIVAISGFNMAILAQLVLILLRTFFPIWPATLTAIAIISVYTLFVGAGGSVVRAAIMSGLLLFAQALHRPTYIPASLAAAALLMSAYDPWILWDISFQLSFAAVMGLALFVPPLQRFSQARLGGLESPTVRRVALGLTDMVGVTLAAQIATLPLTLGYFGRLSLVSLPANTLILPVQPAILVVGGLGVLLGAVWGPGGDLVLEVAGLGLRWTVAVVRGFADLGWSDAALTWPSSAATGFYGLLIGWAIYQATRPRWLHTLLRQRWHLRGLQIAGAVVALLLLSAAWDTSDDRLQADFFEAGPGVLLQSPHGATILVDGGNFPSQLLTALGDALPRNHDQLDVVIATHPERAGALAEVLARYEVGVLAVADTNEATPEYLALLDRAEAQDVPRVRLEDGTRIEAGDGLHLRAILGDELPPALRVEYGAARLLLAAETSPALEARLAQDPHLAGATLVQIVPEAGSRAADVYTRDFLRWTGAQVAILHADITEPPDPTLINRLTAADIRLWRTDEAGGVRVLSDGQRFEIATGE